LISVYEFKIRFCRIFELVKTGSIVSDKSSKDVDNNASDLSNLCRQN